ncbi:MAG TPA: tetratricopeptide repeat protein [Gemmataceae bacterium]
MSDPSSPPPPSFHAPSFGPLPRAELLALLRADQRLRWRRGERIAVEAYPERLPFLRDDIDALLDLVVGEIELRQERAEPFTLEEYQKRFPILAGPLVWRLALHRASAGSVLAGGTKTPPTVPPPRQPVVEAAAEPTAAGDPAPSPAAVADPPATTWGRAWGWCRRHPTRAGVLTGAAAALLVGTFAADFSGRANSSAPTRVEAADVQDEVRQARARAERAERDAAAAKARADAQAAARDEALRLKAAAEESATRAADRGDRERKALDAALAGLIDAGVFDRLDANPLRDRLLGLAQAHYEGVLRDRPSDTTQERGRAFVRLAGVTEARGDAAAAIGQLRQAVELLSADEANCRAELATACSRLGDLLRRAGQLADAEPAGRRAVELWERVAAAEPDGSAGLELAVAHDHLADGLAAAGKSEESSAARRRALDLFRQYARQHPEQPRPVEHLARSASLLGDALLEGEPARAAECYEEAISGWDRARPTTAAGRSRLADVLRNLTVARERLGQSDAADAAAGRALEVRERLAADQPGNSAFELALATAYVTRGERRRDRNRDDEAADDFRRAAPLLAELAKRSPQDQDLVIRLAVNEMCLAQIDLRRRRVGTARAGYRQALGRLDELDGRSPGSADVAVDRGVCCVNLGQLAAMDGKAGDARDWYDRAEQLLKPLADHARLKDYVAAALADCSRGRAQVADRPKAP